MRLALAAILAAAIAVLIWPAFSAPQAPKPPVMGEAMLTETTQATATVMGVDRARHTIMLRMPSGTIRTIKVHRDVKNLGTLRKGDRITATLMDSAAVYVEKGGPRPSAGEMTTVTIRPRGMGVMTVDTKRATGKIQLVDARNRTVTITGPSGRSMTLKVSPSARNLGRLRAGDDVVVRHTEAMALDLKKAGT